MLTLQEAISCLDGNQEGKLFKVNIATHDQESPEVRVIRVRKSEILIDGDKRIILQMSDLTDTYKYNKLQTTQKEY